MLSFICLSLTMGVVIICRLKVLPFSFLMSLLRLGYLTTIIKFLTLNRELFFQRGFRIFSEPATMLVFLLCNVALRINCYFSVGSNPVRWRLILLKRSLWCCSMFSFRNGEGCRFCGDWFSRWRYNWRRLDCWFACLMLRLPLWFWCRLRMVFGFFSWSHLSLWSLLLFWLILLLVLLLLIFLLLAFLFYA